MSTKTNHLLALTIACILSAPQSFAGDSLPIDLSPASPTAAGAARYAVGNVTVQEWSMKTFRKPAKLVLPEAPW